MSAIIQHWNGATAWEFNGRARDLYKTPPRIGMVIGTFAAVPYIHLQLESWRLSYPDVPLLVHDDGSPQQETLASLCQDYGADFECNSSRQPPCVGDLTAFVGGLEWARRQQLDILLKVSRRWVFLVNWVTSLRALAMQSQYATFCSYTTSFGFGFRTECVGLAVKQWHSPIFLDDALCRIERGESVFVEAYVHEFARRFERSNGPTAERWRAAHVMPEDKSGYALWSLIGTDRCERSSSFLWHDCSSAADYQSAAAEYGLQYESAAFADPNQGAGNGY